MYTELLGCASAVILALTISRQVYTQWKTKATAGVSRWMFIGQLTASVGFVVYSWLVDNMVFVFVNAYILLTAIVGQFIYLRNKRHAERNDKREADGSSKHATSNGTRTPAAAKTGAA